MEEKKDPVSVRAYELWEQAGRPEGGAEDFWYQAELECNAGAGGVADETQSGESADSRSSDGVTDKPETKARAPRKAPRRSKTPGASTG